jgi:proteasome lid subunit RPN8/RPN11
VLHLASSWKSPVATKTRKKNPLILKNPRFREKYPNMLRISQALIDQMVAHSRQDHPDEACGVIAGPAGSDLPNRFIPMINAARSPTFYEFDSADLLRLYRELDSNEEDPVVIYHSHTATEAYPSRTDVAYASEPFAHYVLISTRETGTQDGPYEIRSYRIVDGVISEEEIVVA